MQQVSGEPGDYDKTVLTVAELLWLIDELITREYALDDVNEGYDDMLSGRNLRGLIRY